MVSYYFESEPLSATYLIVSGTGLTLKLISFHHVMHDNRKLIRQLVKEQLKNGTQGKPLNTIGMPNDQFEEALKYPKNLNFRHFFRFFLAPTCCYQLIFPSTSEIRLSFLAKRFLEIFFCNLFIM
jgi:hypothetical protein